MNGGVMKAEGWYLDPFGSHEARWFSNGAPTILVRDKGVESHDSPPSTNYAGELTPIEDDDEESGDDPVGADSPEAPSDPYQGVRFGPDFFGQARPQ
jgi:hypothetical protein